MKKKKRLFIIAAVILAVPLLLLLSIILFAGAGRKIGKPLPKGNIEIPVCRSIHYNSTSQIQKEIIKTWSEGEVSDWVDDVDGMGWILQRFIKNRSFERGTHGFMAFHVALSSFR